MIRFPHTLPPSLGSSDAMVFQSLILWPILPIPLVPWYKGIKFMDTSNEMPFSQRLLLGMGGGPLPTHPQARNLCGEGTPEAAAGTLGRVTLMQLHDDAIDDSSYLPLTSVPLLKIPLTLVCHLLPTLCPRACSELIHLSLGFLPRYSTPSSSV